MLADLFPPKQRLFVSGMLITAGQFTTFIFLDYGMGKVDADKLYRIVAVIQVVLVSGLSFFFNERPVEKVDRPKLGVKRYISDLMGHPIRRRFATLYSSLSVLMNVAVTGGFLVLFAKENLGVSKEDYGSTFSVSTIGPLFLSVPFAIVVERYLSKQLALLVGIAALITALAIGWTAESMDALYWLAILWGIGYMITIVTFKPFFSEYVPKDIIGQVSGALNICWGLGGAVAVLGGALLIEHAFDDNYRSIFPMALAMGLVSIYLAARIPDKRFQERKQTPKSLDR